MLKQVGARPAAAIRGAVDCATIDRFLQQKSLNTCTVFSVKRGGRLASWTETGSGSAGKT
jgi:hypothetical protein